MMIRSKFANIAAATMVGLMLCLIAGQALGQTPIDEDPLNNRSKRRLDNIEKVVRELRGIVFQGRNTGKPVVIQSAETDALVQTLTQRVEDLEQSLKRLTGDSETLLRDLDKARKDVTAARDRAAALDARLTSLEAKVAAGLAAPPPPAAGQVGTLPASQSAAGNPADAFAAANMLLLDGDYSGAETAFADFIARYPDNARIGEASYRLGQTLTARKATADAAGAYIAAIRGYPKTTWAPDAMLELSRALVTLGDRINACKVLSDLDTRYPTVPAPVKSRAATTRAQAKCTA